MSDLRVRGIAELALPGFLVGLVAGTAAGGLALVVGQPTGWATVTAFSLGLPLGLLGGGYGLLLSYGRIRLGAFAPAALYWLVGFPLARLVHEVLTRLVLTGDAALPPDPWGFLAYQGIVSAGFAIGFLWLHERIAPRWWQRVAGHNSRARQVYSKYAEHAAAVWEQREGQRRARRKPERERQQ